MFVQHQSIRFLFFLMACECLCASCRARPKSVTIEAQITNPSGSQIFGAHVIVSDTAKDNDKAARMADPLVTYADRAGRLTMRNLPPGEYRLIFVGAPYRTRTETYRLEAGETLRLSVQLRPDEEIMASDCTSKPVTPKLPADLNSVAIHFRRGPCEGTCPAYNLTLYGDGRVEYEGEMNVAVKGRQSYQVEKSAVHDLITRFGDVGFFGYCGHYSGTATDQATVETSLEMGGVAKTVSVYGDSAPESLHDLDGQIDAIVGMTRFVGAPPAHSR